MEFFKIAHISWDEQQIQNQVTVSSLENYCESIVVLEANGEEGEIGTVWGEFQVARQQIRGGIRFALLDCPNALAWTITTGFPPEPNAVVIHGTINRTEHDQDFIESIETFLQEWQAGLMQAIRAS